MRTPPALYVQAIQLFRRGAYPQAIGLLQKVVASHPAEIEPRLQLAKACLDWVQIQARVPLTDIEPDSLSGEAAHYLQLGVSQANALAKTHPASPHVQSLLAMVHLIYSRYEEAQRCLKKALAKDPRNPELLYNMGYALIELERYREALAQFSRLTALHPSHGLGWHMLGQALRFTGDAEAALPAYRKAVSLLPGWHQPYGALSSAMRELERYPEAMEALRGALSVQPHNRELNFALSTLALSIEDWATGWRYYTCRKKGSECDPFPEGFVFPLDTSRPLRIHLDQGLGDELFFLRFVPALVARGMTIEYTTKPKLYPLLQGMPYFARLNQRESGKPLEHDVLVGDLPYITGMTSTAEIPPTLALPLDPARVETLRKQLAAFGPPPYLGVTWQGGRTKDERNKANWDRLLYKEIPPGELGRLARDWPGTVVVMQRVPAPEDLALFSEALGRPSLDWSGLNDDLQDALAGLSLLDEYVGVSNTNMHLSAGIGKTARVLVPYPADWRWLAKGAESPWFPGFRIYRQDRNRQWDSALKQLHDDLKASWG